MRFRCCLLLSLSLVCGCAADSRQTVVEQQLRIQEDRIRDLDQELTEARQKLADQDLELSALREQAAPGATISFASGSRTDFAAEEYVAWGRVTSVEIHELTCGVVSQPDGRWALQFILQPLDDNLDVVKVAGEIRVDVSLPTAAEAAFSRPAGDGADSATSDQPSSRVVTQSISLTESRDRWASGLVASGFYLTVPLPADFETDNPLRILKVNATLDLGGGRIYSDSHEVVRQPDPF